MRMAAGRLRSVGVFVVLSAGVMLALSLLWAATAESQSRPPRSVDIQILGLNDFHGNLKPTTRSSTNPTIYGGAAYLDAYFEQSAAENPNGTITVHAGDMVGASPLISSYFHDEPTVEIMKSLEFNVGTLGNHEFDEGGEEMLRLLRGGQRDDGEQFKDGADGQLVNTSDPDFAGADFPYTSANTVYADSGRNVLKPYRLVERKGERVAFIGVTTDDTPNIVTPDEIAPFRFLDLSTSVNKYVRELRGRNIEAIVVLAHEGGTQSTDPTQPPASGRILEETAQMSDQVDVVIAGHSHSKLDNCVADAGGAVRDAATGGCGKDKLVVESPAFGTAFEQVQMRVNRSTGDVVGARADVIDTVNTGITPDEETQAIVSEYDARIAPIANRVVSSTDQNISRNDNPNEESSLGALIADSQRAYNPNNTEPTDFAFMNPGGIRADIAAGEVTYGELFSVQPFDNQVVKMDLTGAQIYTLLDQQFPPNQAGTTVRVLQVSGLTYTYDRSQPQGQRISQLTNTNGTPDNTGDDTPIEDNDATTYRVAVNSFIASGGDGFTVLKQGQNVETLGSDLDALEAHIDDGATFGPPPDALTRITNATP
jgi:5'-nucleotidase